MVPEYFYRDPVPDEDYPQIIEFVEENADRFPEQWGQHFTERDKAVLDVSDSTHDD